MVRRADYLEGGILAAKQRKTADSLMWAANVRLLTQYPRGWRGVPECEGRSRTMVPRDDGSRLCITSSTLLSLHRWLFRDGRCPLSSNNPIFDYLVYRHQRLRNLS